MRCIPQMRFSTSFFSTHLFALARPLKKHSLSWFPNSPNKSLLHHHLASWAPRELLVNRLRWPPSYFRNWSGVERKVMSKSFCPNSYFPLHLGTLFLFVYIFVFFTLRTQRHNKSILQKVVMLSYVLPFCIEQWCQSFGLAWATLEAAASS